ncbi:hypothetical protein COY27_05015 [Candidatus Woesearchaeota archaeon CG_4_10_14_0_2_um_filter_33_13]|nr:MAG: hypothetical protein COY27_05015 [Candidatus Woesearchaeota archaeon CG_4_10_14_0_2_um_filter_33_13]
MKNIATGISTALEGWMNVSVPVQIEGTELKIHPRYMTALLKTMATASQEYYEGKRAGSPEKSKDLCILLNVLAGRDPRGSGSANLAITDIPYSERAIISRVDRGLDVALKVATASYLGSVGQAILSRHPGVFHQNGHTVGVDYEQPEFAKVGRLSRFDAAARRWHVELRKSRLVQSTLQTTTSVLQQTAFVDTAGSRILQANELLNFALSAISVDAQGREFQVPAYIYFAGADTYSERVVERRIEKIIAEVEARHRAVDITTGPYPTLMDGRAVGTMIHEAFAAHLLSGKYIAEGDSTVFAGRLDQRILPEYLSIIDDPTINGGVASFAFDEEGVATKRAVLVENGILRGYLLDKKSAAMLSVLLGRELVSNGRARSEWATDDSLEAVMGSRVVSPEPRITNMYVESSQMHSEESMYDGLMELMREQNQPYGLYVEGGGGQVDPESGSFSLNPERVWRIDHKGNKELVKEARLVLNPDDISRLLVATGHPYRTSFGVCGAESGHVPTQERAPAFLMASMIAIAGEKDYSTARLKDRLEM